MTHGVSDRLARVYLVRAVVLVRASTGVLASIGRLVAGGSTPTPMPTGSLTSSQSCLIDQVGAGVHIGNVHRRTRWRGADAYRDERGR